ncbi:Nucleotidyl transferase [Candidatus Rhodobacter oscarellae]|uniref:Nucleotidyl transferase n=2 Tax=Candidatus Rhodobacter oscarellae TaxID=1675527 RepID=A0A0J9E856_9RHOB|nr:Nucleotidyl transferase [Candidatus Rhodobacter lobularis]
MIFAAGRGTRMAPLTDTRPKPLIEVAGQALLDHALALTTPGDQVVVNTHYLAPMVEAHLNGSGASTVFEEVLLETGGGLRHALPQFPKGPVITLNSDAVWQGPNVLELLRAAWQPDKMDALLAVIEPERAMGHRGAGDFGLGADGRLRRGPGTVYVGAQILKTDSLELVKDEVFSLNLIWDRMLSEDRLYGMSYPGKWCDVGQPESIALAKDMLGV